MNKTIKLTVDTTAFIDERGFGVAVYIGEGACEPTFEEIFDFETLIMQHFESYMIDDRIHQVDREDAGLMVAKLEQMAEYARQTLDDLIMEGEV
jgi:hypothetical protein